MQTLAAIPFGTIALVILFLILSLAIVGMVLIQKPSGGGLSGAFGSGSGSGSGQTAFGTKTGDALTVITVLFFVVWLGLAMGLNWATKPPSTVIPTAAQGEGPKPDAPATPGGDQPEDADAGAESPADAGDGQTGPAPEAGDPNEVPPATETPADPPADPPAEPGTEPAGDQPGG